MARQNWPPPVALTDYHGPYPRQQLEEARKILIKSLTHPVSDILDRLKPRLGLDSFSHGPAQKPMPIRQKSELAMEEQQQNVQPTSIPVMPSRVNDFLSHVGSINIVQSGQLSHNVNSRPSVSPSNSSCSQSRNIRTLTSPSADTSLNDSSYHLDMLFHKSSDKDNVTNAEHAAQSSVNASLSQGNLVVIDLTDDEKNNQYQVPTFYSGITHTSPKRSLDVTESASCKTLKVGSSKQETNLSQNAVLDAFSQSQGWAPYITPSSSKESPSSTSSDDESQDETCVQNAASSSKSDDNSTSTHDGRSTQITPLPIGVRSPLALTKSTPSKSESAMTFVIYKCDFCSCTNRIWLVMNEHLASAQHFSASLYNAKFDQNSEKLISIKQMAAIKNEHSKSKGLVVACPECCDVFEDIFMCSLHYKYSHDTSDSNESNGGYYSICPVIQHETLTLPRSPVCQMCAQTFESHSKLHKHWASSASHHPLSTAPVGDRIFMLFNCPYCKKMFCDFIIWKSHALSHKFDGDQQTFACEVRHVLQPKLREQLLPLDTGDNNLEGINAELSILRNMRRYLKTITSTKKKKRNVKHRIKYLHKIIMMYDTGKKFSKRGIKANSKYIIRNTSSQW